MKLAVVSVHYPYGRNETYLEHELMALATIVGQVAVYPLCASGKNTRMLPAGVELGSLSRGVKLYCGAILFALRHAARVRAILADLLRSQSPALTKLKNLGILARAIDLGRRLRADGVEHVHGYWLSTPATAAYVASRIANIPWSATAHRWDIYERNALDLKFAGAAFIRTISQRGRRDLNGFRQAGAPIVCVPIGIPIPPFVSRNFGPIERLQLLCPAALVPIKGHETLLESLALCARKGISVRCTLAGDGPERPRLERLARSLGLGDSVVFAGHVEQRALHAALEKGAFHAVVLASHEHPGGLMEGVPAALVEAMARAVPVIATNSGSVGELIDATTGRLVAPGNPAELAEAIVHLQRDFASAKKRAARGFARVASSHDAYRQMSVLAGLLASPSSDVERTIA
ncbi:MAG TPA: glycosyltransferase [Candidatus Dormibacteraeota bacterium]|nr:glycosyltransferase [Candidatus Dormibacteraeota bacterium]